MAETFEIAHVLMTLMWLQCYFLIFLEIGTGTDDLFFEILNIHNKKSRYSLLVTKEINYSKGN